MLSSGMQPQKTDIHPILPLYMVIATAFAGYGLMVALFIPMLIHDTGFFDKSIPTSTRAIYGGILLALYPLNFLHFVTIMVFPIINVRRRRKCLSWYHCIA